jgi:hypothetical protein
MSSPARTHLTIELPLSPVVVELLDSLPRRGAFVFLLTTHLRSRVRFRSLPGQV